MGISGCPTGHVFADVVCQAELYVWPIQVIYVKVRRISSRGEHPSPCCRIERIQKLMPAADPYKWDIVGGPVEVPAMLDQRASTFGRQAINGLTSVPHIRECMQQISGLLVPA